MRAAAACRILIVSSDVVLPSRLHVPARVGRAAGGSRFGLGKRCGSIAEGSVITTSVVVNAGDSSDFRHPIVGNIKFRGGAKRGIAEACYELGAVRLHKLSCGWLGFAKLFRSEFNQFVCSLSLNQTRDRLKNSSFRTHFVK